MKIDSDYQVGIGSNVAHSKTVPADAPPSAKAVDLTESSALASKLDRTADTRAEVVEKAQLLAQDPEYPPEEVIDKIAQLIARGLGEADE